MLKKENSARKAIICSEKQIFKGYFSVNKYEIKADNLDPDKKPLHFEREVMISRDSVMVLIYATTVDSFVFCQQFRPGVFLNKSNDDPYFIECIAGTIDKEKSPQEIACLEVKEEAGLEVTKLEKIATAYRSPGLMTEKTHYFYAQTEDEPKAGYYGVESEDILTHVVSREKTFSLLEECKILDTGTLLMLNWFRANKNM
ncbi:ADP-ribose pyrophosphatase (plasmid) [Legionella adelaidensis]|uniref:GDP-mannose pyrophosphatase n=1 Tax=Legionella adelaidensis TaxID=45056 RepID=A0A0W0R1K8_9GAMM|nr:NUDIX hydrolase [Legionella adelaidensis]KTC64976.1 ADP-ribose pyrophosphatase [Legionella adelaidensis]VEH85344.1 ADP-ribose pyrophosphatase [Legionella adelaidensis]